MKISIGKYSVRKTVKQELILFIALSVLGNTQNPTVQIRFTARVINSIMLEISLQRKPVSGR